MNTPARAVLATVSAAILAGTGYAALHRGPAVSSIPAEHNPVHTVSCASGVFAGGSHYPKGSVATATIDGKLVSYVFPDAVTEVHGASLPNPDKTVSHTYEVQLVSADGLEGFDEKGTIPSCDIPASTTSMAASSSTAPTSAPTVASSTTLTPTTAVSTIPTSTTVVVPTFNGTCDAIQAPDSRVCAPSTTAAPAATRPKLVLPPTR